MYALKNLDFVTDKKGRKKSVVLTIHGHQGIKNSSGFLMVSGFVLAIFACYSLSMTADGL